MKIYEDYINTIKTAILAISVRRCHPFRSNRATLKDVAMIQNISYSFFKIPFLNDSPLRSIL